MLSGSNRALDRCNRRCQLVLTRDAWDRGFNVQRMSIALSRSRKLPGLNRWRPAQRVAEGFRLLDWGAVPWERRGTACNHGLGRISIAQCQAFSVPTSCGVSFRLLARRGWDLSSRGVGLGAKMTVVFELAQNRRSQDMELLAF